MARAEVLKVADVVRKQSRRSLEKLEEAAAKRADTLPYAAVVLERVMQAGAFDRVILSAFGLREGVLLERMSAKVLAVHPLIAAAEALAGRSERTRLFGPALEQWIAPMFAGRPFVFAPSREQVYARGRRAARRSRRPAPPRSARRNHVRSYSARAARRDQPRRARVFGRGDPSPLHQGRAPPYRRL
ncbi:MAG: hypothetical protein WDM79_06200 [Terricaulis sp.]